MRFTQTSLFALVALLLFGTCIDPESRKNFLTARVYNEQTKTGESNYLNTIDINKLTDLQKAAVTARRGELEDIGELLENESAPPLINVGVRCGPTQPRDPPGPCPILEDALRDFPIGTQIELDMIGAFMDIVEAANPQARILADQGTAQLVTTDGKKVFAEGTFSAYDSLFHTAWYVFDVKKRALALGPLVLKITTQVIVNQQVKSVTIEKSIPAGTFLSRDIN